jgi:uncharacterized protein involved in tolerance to divalent cations
MKLLDVWINCPDALLVKTRADLFDAVAAAARAMHPDETPAIHAVEAAAVTPDYLAWAESETVAPGG